MQRGTRSRRRPCCQPTQRRERCEPSRSRRPRAHGVVAPTGEADRDDARTVVDGPSDRAGDRPGVGRDVSVGDAHRHQSTPPAVTRTEQAVVPLSGDGRGDPTPAMAEGVLWRRVVLDEVPPWDERDAQLRDRRNPSVEHCHHDPAVRAGGRSPRGRRHRVEARPPTPGRTLDRSESCERRRCRGRDRARHTSRAAHAGRIALKCRASSRWRRCGSRRSDQPLRSSGSHSSSVSKAHESAVRHGRFVPAFQPVCRLEYWPKKQFTTA